MLQALPLSNQRFSSPSFPVQAIHDFDGDLESNQLRFKVGELIVVHGDQDKSGPWWWGATSSLKGYFPSSFVQPVENTTVAIAPAVPHAVGVVLFDYEADPGGHAISIRAGDYVSIIGDLNNGWYHGVNSNGESGYFPETYVSVVDPAQHRKNPMQDNSTTDVGGEGLVSDLSITGSGSSVTGSAVSIASCTSVASAASKAACMFIFDTVT